MMIDSINKMWSTSMMRTLIETAFRAVGMALTTPEDNPTQTLGAMPGAALEVLPTVATLVITLAPNNLEMARRNGQLATLLLQTALPTWAESNAWLTHGFTTAARSKQREMQFVKRLGRIQVTLTMNKVRSQTTLKIQE